MALPNTILGFQAASVLAEQSHAVNVALVDVACWSHHKLCLVVREQILMMHVCHN